MYSSVRET